MDWNDNFREIMAELAAKDGKTYQDVTDEMPPAQLFLVDTKAWWQQLWRRN